ISSYDFSIRYRSGKSNIDADALSRLPSMDSDSVKAVCQTDHSDEVVLSLPIQISAIDESKIILCQLLTPLMLRNAKKMMR
ncbi:hypothetical protein ScPMuIL_003583, partial [Solemya velum]